MPPMLLRWMRLPLLLLWVRVEVADVVGVLVNVALLVPEIWMRVRPWR